MSKDATALLKDEIINNRFLKINTETTRKRFPEGSKVILHTNADSDEAVPEMIDIFDSLQDDLRSFSIDFEYDFTADHDRKIVANNGWSIYLGRGLDIFDPYPKFTMGCAAQENRRCRAFSVTYTNQ